MNLLIIEADEQLLKSIKGQLASVLITCDTTGNYLQAKQSFNSRIYSCIILDWELLKASVLNPAKELQQLNTETGIMVISRGHNAADKIESLNNGADDFMSLPLDLEELEARVFAIIRRKAFGGKEEIMLGDHLNLNLQNRTLSFKKANIALTKTEYRILLLFVSHPNQLITKKDLQDYLKTNDLTDGDGGIYSHIKNIRKKLGRAEAPNCIRMLYGMGYIFNQLN